MDTLTRAFPSRTRIDLAGEADFALGALNVRPSRREVDAAGVRHILQPRVMQVLVALAHPTTEVVSHDELILRCWGGLSVGDDAVGRCIGQLRRFAGQWDTPPFEIETIAGVGYRLAPANKPSAQTSLPLPNKPSIAVMPFANLSGDPEQDFIADGMVEEIVTSLARFKSIFVIGSGSTLSLKGRAISPREVGRLLGVRYVLEGSVRKAGDRVRVSVKLSDSEGGAQVHVDRFEGTLQDVFALQDEVSLKVAGQIEPTIEVAEFRRAFVRPTESLGSYELFLRAWALERTFVKANVFAALDLLDRAIALDPNYAPALALAAICHRVIFNFRWSDDPESIRRQGLEFADRALRTGADDANVLANVASVLAYLGRYPWDAIGLLDRAIELNPGSASVWFYSGVSRLQVGQADLGVEHLETAIRLDPVGPTRPNLMGFLGQGRFQQGRFAEASVLQRELLQTIESPRGYGFLAASLGQLGRIEEGAEALARYRALTNQPIDDLARTHLKDSAHLKLFMDGIACADGGPRPDSDAGCISGRGAGPDT
jgi:TolB-like protein/Tfp pilus assembly protein PilF